MSSQPSTPRIFNSATKLAAATRVKVTAKMRSGSTPSSRNRASRRFIAKLFPCSGTSHDSKELSVRLGYRERLTRETLIPSHFEQQLIILEPHNYRAFCEMCEAQAQN